MAASAAAAPGQQRSKLADSLYAYGFIAPAIAAMVVASFVPLAFTVFVAFTNWDQYHPALVQGFQPAGFANFKEILDSLQGELLGVIVWTLGFAFFSTLGNFFVGLGLAFLLNNPHMSERNLYRTVLILPWAVPGSIMTLAWAGLLNTDYGPINVFLGNIHLGPLTPGHIPLLVDPL